MKIYFVRTPKPKRFNLKPRYYDEEKEKREQRKVELGLSSSDDPSIRLRSRIQHEWHKDSRRKKKKTDATRTIFYLVLLIILIYLIFFR